MTRSTSGGSFFIGCTSGAHLYTGSTSGGSYFMGRTSGGPPLHTLIPSRVRQLTRSWSLRPPTPGACCFARLLVSHPIPFKGVRWLACLLASHTLIPYKGSSADPFVDHCAFIPSRGLSADPFVDHCALIPSRVRWLACLLASHTLIPSKGSSADPFVDHCALIPSRGLSADPFIDHCAIIPSRVHWLGCLLFTLTLLPVPARSLCRHSHISGHLLA
jgi:hypothetical protein